MLRQGTFVSYKKYMNENLLMQSLLITLVAFVGYMHSYWGSTMNNRPIVVAP